MPIVTPDVEGHLITRLVALAPSYFVLTPVLQRNVWPGPEQPPGGSILTKCSFVQWYTEDRELFYGGQGRYFRCQIFRRFGRDGWGPTGRAGAMTEMRAVYDAVHLSGEFTVSGTSYLDIRAIDAPVEVQPYAMALNVNVWHRG